VTKKQKQEIRIRIKSDQNKTTNGRAKENSKFKNSKMQKWIKIQKIQRR